MPDYLAILAALFVLACRSAEDGRPGAEDRWAADRARMVLTQLASRDIDDKDVLEAMKKVPRHKFVPGSWRAEAYQDHPVPIGEGQTISQPYIVAYMTQAIKPKKEHKVLEIGTGSGYQAAILAELVKEVYSIEIIESLGKQAEETLQDLGYKNISIKIGDGYQGWHEKGPFDAIMITAAPPEVPSPLLEQLKEGGVLIAPVGLHYQDLVLYTRGKEGVTKEVLIPVRFVPMTGKAME